MSKPIRVAFISPIFYSGGIPRTFLAIAEGLKDRGYEFHMINSFVDEFQERFKKCGKCIYLHDNGEIIQYLQQNKIDIVQTNGFPRANYIAYVAGVPRIVERLSSMNAAFNFEKEPVDCIIGSTDAVYNKARRDYPDKNHELIYNGIDLHTFSSSARSSREDYGIGKDDIIIGYCGRIAPEKCLDKLVDVFARVKQAEKKVKLVLLGTPYEAYVDALKAQIDALEMIDDVIFIGHTEYPENVLKIFDIGVISSGRHTALDGKEKVTREGFANSILEKMAMQIPIVSTNSGELPSLIRDGYNGYLIDMEDMDTFYDRLLKLIRDKNLREKMGKNGRAFVAEHFNIQTMINRYDSLYRYVISDEFRQRYPDTRNAMAGHYLGSAFELTTICTEPKNILVFRSGSRKISDSIISTVTDRFPQANVWLLCHQKSIADAEKYDNIRSLFVYKQSDSFDAAKMRNIIKAINNLNLDYLFFIFNDFIAKDENRNVVDIVEAIKADNKILVSKGDIKFLWPQRKVTYVTAKGL